MAVHVSDRPRAGPMLPVLIGAPAATSKVAYSPEKLEEFRGKADKAVDFAGSSEPVEKESVSACSAA
eukprot:g5025.t1